MNVERLNTLRQRRAHTLPPRSFAALLIVCSTIVTSCESSSKVRSTHTTPSTAAPNAHVVDPACAHYKQFTNFTPTYGEPKPRAQLIREFSDQLAKFATLRNINNADIRVLLRWENNFIEAVHNRVLAEWGDDGVDFFRKIDNADKSAGRYVIDQGVKLRDGTLATVRDVFDRSFRLTGSLALYCNPKPSYAPLASGPLPRATPDVMWYTELGEVRYTVRRVGLNGERRDVLLAPAGMSASGPVLSPDRTKLLVSVYNSKTQQVFIGNADGTHLRPLGKPIERWSCASWSDSNNVFTVNRKVAPRQWVLSSVNLATGAIVSLTDPRPWRMSACGTINSGAVTYTIPDESLRDSVWTKKLNGHEAPGRLVDMPGCGVSGPYFKPDSREFLSIVSCRNVYGSGLYLQGVDRHHFHQIVTGHVGPPAWSPDGNWIAFPYLPFGKDSSSISLWIARPDGTGAHQINDKNASWPAW